MVLVVVCQDIPLVCDGDRCALIDVKIHHSGLALFGESVEVLLEFVRVG